MRRQLELQFGNDVGVETGAGDAVCGARDGAANEKAHAKRGERFGNGLQRENEIRSRHGGAGSARSRRSNSARTAAASSAP